MIGTSLDAAPNLDSNWGGASTQRSAMINQQQESSQASRAENSFQQVLVSLHSERQTFTIDPGMGSAADPSAQRAEFDDLESQPNQETSCSDENKYDNNLVGPETRLDENRSSGSSGRGSGLNEGSSSAQLSPLQVLLSRTASIRQGDRTEGKSEQDSEGQRTAQLNVGEQSKTVSSTFGTAGKTKLLTNRASTNDSKRASNPDPNPPIVPSSGGVEAQDLSSDTKDSSGVGKAEERHASKSVAEGKLTKTTGAANVTRQTNTGLAFAVRLTPDDSGAGQEKADNSDSSKVMPQFSLKDAPVSSLEPSAEPRAAATPSDRLNDNSSVPVLLSESGNMLDGMAFSEPPVIANDDPVQSEVLEQESSNSEREPVRDVKLQISGSQNQRVEIRLLETDGELKVSVRSADSGLARSLQERIPELTTRLDQQHFRSEVWIPRTQTDTDQRHFNGKPKQEWQSPDQDDRRNKNGREQDRPGWVDELEPSPAKIIIQGAK